MSKKEFSSLTDILNHGLGSQNRLAELNKLVSERIKNTDHHKLHDMINELLSIAEEPELNKMTDKEKRLDELNSSFSDIRIEILKEAELFRALRMTNDAYISRLDEELKEAEEYLEKPADKDLADAYTGYDIMQKRAQELKLTRSVALSFSKQISLTADNLTSLSDRVWNVQMNLIPLLRGMISAETLKIMRDELNMLFKEPEENHGEGLPVYV